MLLSSLFCLSGINFTKNYSGVFFIEIGPMPTPDFFTHKNLLKSRKLGATVCAKCPTFMKSNPDRTVKLNLLNILFLMNNLKMVNYKIPKKLWQSIHLAHPGLDRKFPSIVTQGHGQLRQSCNHWPKNNKGATIGY